MRSGDLSLGSRITFSMMAKTPTGSLALAVVASNRKSAASTTTTVPLLHLMGEDPPRKRLSLRRDGGPISSKFRQSATAARDAFLHSPLLQHFLELIDDVRV